VKAKKGVRTSPCLTIQQPYCNPRLDKRRRDLAALILLLTHLPKIRLRFREYKHTSLAFLVGWNSANFARTEFSEVRGALPGCI
jgi:hypothetical protein